MNANIPLTNSYGWPVDLKRKRTRAVEFSGELLVHTEAGCDGETEIQKIDNVWLYVAGKSFHVSLLEDEKGKSLNEIILEEAGAEIINEIEKPGL